MNKADPFNLTGKAEFLEVHSPLSAIIAEKAGFAQGWISSLTMSALMGVCDRGELPWSAIVDQVSHIRRVSALPLLVDVDTGYGDANIFRHVCNELSRVGAQGVCIEDKVFPKRNSFSSAPQELESISVMQGKISSVHSLASNRLFIVARTEAFILGFGVEEAVKRCQSYVSAGADAVLVHSKKSTDEEVRIFLDQWDAHIPVLVVPTTFGSTSKHSLFDGGVSGIIWANHMLRASVCAMTALASEALVSETIDSVACPLESVETLFDLTGEPERIRFDRQLGIERENAL